MSSPAPSPAPARVTRRAVALGAAWAVPTIAFGRAAPAMAASPATGCFTLNWTSGGFQSISSGVQGSTGVRAGTLTANTGATGLLSATVTQSRTAGTYAGPASFITNTTGDFGVATAGTTTNNVYGSQGQALLPNSPGGLILNQAPTTSNVEPSETITFSFSQPVKSVEFTVYDLSRSTSTSACSMYTDAIKSTYSLTAVSDVQGSSCTGLQPYGTLPATGAAIYRSQASCISGTTGHNTTLTYAPAGSLFSFTYYQPDGTSFMGSGANPTGGCQGQYVIISSVKVCV